MGNVALQRGYGDGLGLVGLGSGGLRRAAAMSTYFALQLQSGAFKETVTFQGAEVALKDLRDRAIAFVNTNVRLLSFLAPE